MSYELCWLMFVNTEGLKICTREDGATSIVKDYDVRLLEMVDKGMEIGEMQATASEVRALDIISEKVLRTGNKQSRSHVQEMIHGHRVRETPNRDHKILMSSGPTKISAQEKKKKNLREMKETFSKMKPSAEKLTRRRPASHSC